MRLLSMARHLALLAVCLIPSAAAFTGLPRTQSSTTTTPWWIRVDRVRRLLHGLPRTVRRSSRTTECHALTPVGPFCPFRSEETESLDLSFQQLNTKGPEFTIEMDRFRLDLQMGQQPDRDRLVKVADDIRYAVQSWTTLMTRVQTSDDFQTREYAKLTEAHLNRHNHSVEIVSSLMLWQSDCLRCMANNSTLPVPPPCVEDIELLMQRQQNPVAGSESSPPQPSMTAMAAAQGITAAPFTGDESAFLSETVRTEYKQLCKDHASLIKLGARYSQFDPLRKLVYLDQVSSVQERWDIFFARFQLLGSLNQEYVKQCDNFLASMGLREEDFRQLLKKGHDLMREEAEEERKRYGL